MVHQSEQKPSTMAYSRRSFLNSILAFLLFWLPTVGRSRETSPASGFVGTLAAAIDQETGGRQPSTSELVVLEAPDIAEDGSIVPVSIASDLSSVDTIWVFVEKNPNPLTARFDLHEDLDAFVSLRIKLNESCEIIAMVRSAGKYFTTQKKVRVVVGGCG